MGNLNLDGLILIDSMFVGMLDDTGINISDMKLTGDVGMLQNKVAENNIIAPNFAANSNGNDVSLIEKWESMRLLAEGESDNAKKKYEEFSKLLTETEDKKNAAYIKKDNILAEQETKEARYNSLLPVFQELSAKSGDIEKQLPGIQKRLDELRRKKKTYDALRWVPFVNIVSLMIEEITGDIRRLEKLEQENRAKIQELNSMGNELKVIAPEIAVLDIALKVLQTEINALENQLAFLIDERKKTAEAMVSWGDRKKYYDMMVSELRHLISIQADDEEIEKFIKTNPPQFKLVA